MNDPILILILAPLCIGLVLMFLSQMGRNHKIEQQANALAARVSALEKEAAEEKRIHEQKIQELDHQHKQAVERQNQEIEGLKVMLDFHKKTGDSSARLVTQLIETLEKYQK